MYLHSIGTPCSPVNPCIHSGHNVVSQGFGVVVGNAGVSSTGGGYNLT